jgi:DNA polymerase elongation subunit (family B)
MGVIAQETQEVVPQVVAESEDGTLSVAYGNLSGLFIEAFKEQQAEINDLKATVLELREIINKLK